MKIIKARELTAASSLPTPAANMWLQMMTIGAKAITGIDPRATRNGCTTRNRARTEARRTARRSAGSGNHQPLSSMGARPRAVLAERLQSWCAVIPSAGGIRSNACSEESMTSHPIPRTL